MPGRIAVAQERQPRDHEDRQPELQHGQGDQRSRGVRQHVPEEHVQVRPALEPRGLDEHRRAHAQHLGAHHPGEHRHRRDARGDRGVDGLEPERADDHDREQERRDGEQHVHEPREYDVGPRPQEAREQPDEPTHDDADRDGHEGAGDRGLRAVDDAGEQVAAEVIGAEQVRGARRLKLVCGHPLCRVLRGEQRGGERERQYDGHDDERHEDAEGDGEADAARSGGPGARREQGCSGHTVLTSS